jgi:transposase InsO family protein
MEIMSVVNNSHEAIVILLQSFIYMFGIPKWILTDNETQFKGAKFPRCYSDFGISHQASAVAHPQTNGQVKRANGLILHGMKTRMFHDLEAKGKNWHKELPSVLWAPHTNINRATRDTPFHLVYGAYAVLAPEIFLESAQAALFNEENQAEVRELDPNLLEEKHNKALAIVQKY